METVKRNQCPLLETRCKSCGGMPQLSDLIRTSSVEVLNTPLHHCILLLYYWEILPSFREPQGKKKNKHGLFDHITTLNFFLKDAVMMILRPTVLYCHSSTITPYSTVCLKSREKKNSKHEFQSGKSCCQCPRPPTHYRETFCSISSHSGRLVT